MLSQNSVADAEVSSAAVENELERILASAKFARAKRLSTLLRFTVTQTLQGNAETLKEYVIGTEVLEKPESYDPRNDSLVRVLANRLRGKLKEYYSNGGSNDPLVIEFPKGRYVPRFHRREHLDSEIQKKLRARNACSFGRFLATRLSEPVLEEAAARFEDAIESDPGFAPAHTGLATTYAFQAFLGFSRPKALWPLVRTQAETARLLDDMSPDAHLCLGLVSAFEDHNWKNAEAHFLKAIERDAFSSAGHMWLALASRIPSGEPAGQEIATAQELIPAPLLEEAIMLSLYFAGRYSEMLNRLIAPPESALLPDWRPWLKSCALAALRRFEEAIDALEQVNGPTRRVIAMLGYLYGMAGRQSEAREALARCLARREQGEWVGNYELALIHAGLSQGTPNSQTDALAFLRAASREREPWMAFLSVDPRFTPLRRDPDFVELAPAAA
jgi:tetratricopeptide (TPR) repeat protein